MDNLRDQSTTDGGRSSDRKMSNNDFLSIQRQSSLFKEPSPLKISSSYPTYEKSKVELPIQPTQFRTEEEIQ